MVLIILLTMAVFMPAVLAASSQTEPKGIVIGAEQTIASDYVGIYDGVEIGGRLDGNLIAASQGAARIDGTIEGTILLATGEAKITGTAKKDLLLLSLIATLDGAMVEDDASIFTATSLNASKETQFLGDAYIFSSGMAVISGSVGGELFVMARSVVLDGAVAGNVKIYSEDIQIGANAVIAGDVTYYSTLNARVDSGATVGGTVEQRPPVAIPFAQKSSSAVLHLSTVLAQILFLAFLAWVIMRAWPSLLPRSATVIKQKPFVTFFIGIGTILLLFIISLILTLTVVMLVPGLFFMGIFFLGLLLSILPTAYLLSAMYGAKGAMLGTEKKRIFVPMVFGIALLELLSGAPYIGFGVSMLITGWGMGSFVVLFLEKMRSSRKQRGNTIDEAR